MTDTKKHILIAIRDLKLVHVSVRLAYAMVRDIDPDYAHSLDVISEQIIDLEDSLNNKVY